MIVGFLILMALAYLDHRRLSEHQQRLSEHQQRLSAHEHAMIALANALILVSKAPSPKGSEGSGESTCH